MTEASATLHEPAAMLSGDTHDLHRALVSLQEELEAVDWYRQRAKELPLDLRPVEDAAEAVARREEELIRVHPGGMTAMAQATPPAG